MAVMWLMAIFIPLMATDPNTPPNPWFWIVMVGATVLFTYSGVKSWRQRSRTPLIVRVLVPVTLLAVSWVMLRTGTWDRIRY